MNIQEIINSVGKYLRLKSIEEKPPEVRTLLQSLINTFRFLQKSLIVLLWTIGAGSNIIFSRAIIFSYINLITTMQLKS